MSCEKHTYHKVWSHARDVIWLLNCTLHYGGRMLEARFHVPFSRIKVTYCRLVGAYLP